MQESVLYIVLALLGVVIYLLLSQRKHKGDDKNKEEIESINGVKKLYIGSIDTLNECFDIIVMIHALEHIPDPVQYLVALSNKLIADSIF